MAVLDSTGRVYEPRFRVGVKGDSAKRPEARNACWKIIRPQFRLFEAGLARGVMAFEIIWLQFRILSDGTRDLATAHRAAGPFTGNASRTIRFGSLY
jgi:hypothetical protein